MHPGVEASLRRTRLSISGRPGKRRRECRKSFSRAAENQMVAEWLQQHGLSRLSALVLYPRKESVT
jgi:hypothetical protein